MKAWEIIRDVMCIVGLDSDADLLTEAMELDPLAPLNSDIAATTRLLLDALNRVVAEIADFYLPLRAENSVCVDESGCVPFALFDFPPAYFFSAKIANKKVRFAELPNRLRINGAKTGEIVTFDYAYIPPPLALYDSLPFNPARPDSRVITYGVAAEFFLLNSQTDSALCYDRKYKDGLAESARLRRAVTV